MDNNKQKMISLGLISLAALGGFEALIYILNLNQTQIYLHTAFWIYLYMVFQMAFLFDLHLKNSGSLVRARARHENIAHRLQRTWKVFSSAAADRFSHFRSRRHINLWLHYLLIPSFIYWGTMSLLYSNLGFYKIQQVLAVLSSMALVAGYLFVREALYLKKEQVRHESFAVLTVIKIYASAVLFASSMSMLRRYCMDAGFFEAEVFAYSFLLIYQALFQHRAVTLKNLGITTVIALTLALVGFYVYSFWGYNYFTAAIFLSACYNLLWGLFHYYLDRVLTWKVFLEILLVSMLVAAMVVNVTNFSAKILDGCRY